MGMHGTADWIASGLIVLGVVLVSVLIVARTDAVLGVALLPVGLGFAVLARGTLERVVGASIVGAAMIFALSVAQAMDNGGTLEPIEVAMFGVGAGVVAAFGASSLTRGITEPTMRQAIWLVSLVGVPASALFSGVGIAGLGVLGVLVVRSRQHYGAI